MWTNETGDPWIERESKNNFLGWLQGDLISQEEAINFCIRYRRDTEGASGVLLELIIHKYRAELIEMCARNAMDRIWHSMKRHWPHAPKRLFPD